MPPVAIVQEVIVEEPNVNLFSWGYHLDGITKRELRDYCGRTLEGTII